jgi:chromate transport protein ChrA
MSEREPAKAAPEFEIAKASRVSLAAILATFGPRGTCGALVASLGMILPGAAVVMGLGLLYQRPR